MLCWITQEARESESKRIFFFKVGKWFGLPYLFQNIVSAKYMKRGLIQVIQKWWWLAVRENLWKSAALIPAAPIAPG